MDMKTKMTPATVLTTRGPVPCLRRANAMRMSFLRGVLKRRIRITTIAPRIAGKSKIVICERGSNPRVAKGLVVKKAGGVRMILANGVSNGEGLVGDAHLIPTCAL
ncbi:hypothetical protein HYC85_009043 [Camellia sinensis]|uniref:PA domain-containing protein n=1 Tax=Camellia sinensis TaxID=4442 RepID=A0A7J7HUX8_CAMSI|nr:hypothetical protein HYC85_009043 [Camellia sinensis]